MTGGRVLRIVTRLNRGGPLRQLQALVPRLARLGWSGPVLAGTVESYEPDGTADLEAVGVRVERVPALRREIHPSRDGKAWKAIRRWIRETNPDVVHTHLGKAGLLGRLAAAWCAVPAVHTYHGHHFQARWPWGGMARSLERSLGLWTRAGVALTPRQRRDLVEIYRVLPRANVAVIAPGIDVDDVQRRADAVDAARLRARTCAEGEVLLVWAGRFVAVKDPLLLVEALRRAPPSVRLVMLGGGPLRARVRDRLAAASLESRVLLPGPVADVAPWIAAADAVVLSSRSEGASIVVLEAKALEKPAIVPTVGGLPDIVDHGKDGLWVPPGDADALAAAMARLAGDPALARDLGRAAGLDVERRYGADRLARETAALYERVVRG